VKDALIPPPKVDQPRQQKDWLSLVAVISSALALLSCMPMFSAVGATLGFIAFHRARAAHKKYRLATTALVLAGISLVVQIAVWQMASNWLMPAMQRRTVAAITAACQGDWRTAVPTQDNAMFLQQAAPSQTATETFSNALATARGGVQSISIVNPEISGSMMAPTISMAIVVNFQKGSATGSAKVQWVPSNTFNAEPWMPSVRLLELEINVTKETTLSLLPDQVSSESALRESVAPTVESVKP